MHKTDLNVLVVEDNRVNIFLIETLLTKKFGCKIDVAVNGIEALEKLIAGNYDLVMMDMHMPYMDGISATKIIRACELGLDAQEIIELFPPDSKGKIEGLDIIRDLTTKYKGGHINIVALTANVLKGDREKFIDVGVDEYLAKPIDNMKLKEILNKYSFGKIEEVNMPAFDSQVILDRFGITQEQLNEMVDSFYSTLDEDIAKLAEAVNAGDTDGIMRQAHYLRGACMNLGFAEPEKLLGDMETAARGGELPKFDISELKDSFSRLREQIAKGE